MTKETQDNTHLDITDNTDDLALDTIDESADKPVPIAKLLKWRKQGLSYAEIGTMVGTSKQAVHQRLAPYRDTVDNLPDFKDHRADIFALHQSRLLDSLTPDEIKRIPPVSRITGAAILYDKERLERGKSTSNVAYADLSSKWEENEARLAELRAELNALPKDEDNQVYKQCQLPEYVNQSSRDQG